MIKQLKIIRFSMILTMFLQMNNLLKSLKQQHNQRKFEFT